MDDIQAENGHVDIANAIVEALCRTQLSGYESRVLWALFRKTYGWHKKADRISLSQFQALTGLPIPKISATLARLAQRKMVDVTENGNSKAKSYGFQKVFSLWVETGGITEKGNTRNREYPKSGRVAEIGNDARAKCSNDSVISDIEGFPKKVLPKTGIPEKGITENGSQGLPISASTKETITKEKKPMSAFEIERLDFFEELWKVYPRKLGKEDARRHYLKSVKTDNDLDRINCALENYLIEIKGRELQYVKHGSAWFHKWQDWENVDGR